MAKNPWRLFRDLEPPEVFGFLTGGVKNIPLRLLRDLEPPGPLGLLMGGVKKIPPRKQPGLT